MMRSQAGALLRKNLGRRAAMPTPATLAVRYTSTNLPLSNPALSNIEKRWEGMPLPEQAELWMKLRDRMRENWKEMTIAEKKAGTC